MFHFSTGILLYLALGALAAPPQARSTVDAVASVESDNPSTSATTSASQSTGAPSGLPASDDASSDTSVPSSVMAAQESSPGSSGTTPPEAASASSPAASSSSSDSSSPESPGPSSSAQATAEPHNGLSSQLDQTLLFGPDLRPNITHLAAVQNATEGMDNSTMFEAAGSILLALTKCNDHGYWIKGMFGIPDPGHDTQKAANKNPNLAGVRIHSLGATPEDPLVQFNVTVDRYDLKNVTSWGVTSDKISTTEPWWPYALFEAGLQAGWNPKLDDVAFNVKDLLAILTGVHVKEVPPNDEFYGNITNHLQYTPVLLREKDQAVYSVLMTPAYNDTTGHPRLPLAGPYLHPDKGAAFSNNTVLADLKPRIEKVLYLDGLLSLAEIEKKQKEDGKAEPKDREDTDNKADGAKALSAGSDDAKATGGESDAAKSSEASSDAKTLGGTGEGTSAAGSATDSSPSVRATGESSIDSVSAEYASTSAVATGEGSSAAVSAGATSTVTSSGDATSDANPSATT